MKKEMIVPTASDYLSLDGNLDSPSAGKGNCIASCRGCQCHVNTMSIDDIFSDVVTPSQSVYDKVAEKINTGMAYSAGGCKCNCTSCNSCRCDCSCRSYIASGEENDSIWA